MARSTRQLLVIWLWFSLSKLLAATSQTEERLCSLPPSTYVRAKREYPAYASALYEVERRGVAVWLANGGHQDVHTTTRLLAECDEASRVVIVVDGLQPEKDERRAASLRGGDDGITPNADLRSRYERFMTHLHALVQNRRVLYVLEPGAVERVVGDRRERRSADFTDDTLFSLETAIRVLSENPNAKLYVDVAARLLEQQENATRTAAIFTQLTRGGDVTGIALNTANNRRTADLVGICDQFQRSMARNVVDSVHCAIDTSRNHWRQVSGSTMRLSGEAGVPGAMYAGLGEAPTGATEYANVDYFIWTHAPGTSHRRARQGSHAVNRALTGITHERRASSRVRSTPATVSSADEDEFDIAAFKRLWTNSALVLTQDTGLGKSANTTKSSDDDAESAGGVFHAAGSNSLASSSSSMDQGSEERTLQPGKFRDTSRHHPGSWSLDNSASCGGADGSASGSASDSASEIDNNTITTVAPTSIPTPVPAAVHGDSAASATASSADMGSVEDDSGSSMSMAQMLLIAGLALAGTVTVAVVFVVDWSHCSQRPSETGSFGAFEVFSNQESHVYSL